jgi:hypothetical protein
VICDRPDLTLQAVLADQLRRIRHALIFITVAVATAAEWELNSNGLRSGSGCRLSCRKSKSSSGAMTKRKTGPSKLMDCSLAKTNSIIYTTALSGTSRKPGRSS